MKKLQLFNWIFIAFIAFQFSSCENELLEGEFIQPDVPTNIEEGAFVATIGNDNSFVANATNANLNLENVFTISGMISETGEKITMVVENPAVGVFSLISGTGFGNSAKYFENGETTTPYISTSLYGAEGVLEITEFDTENNKITGTFNFTGARIALDAEGNPILDANGNLTIESEEITEGAFNKIVFTNEDQGGGGTDPTTDTFFAIVDGVDFISTSVTTTQSEIAGISMIKIVALNGNEELIRIDIPEDLGVGTFDMEELSDGTKLIALYNSNTGGENLTSNPGTITITKFNTNTGVIEATFAFTATDPIGIDPAVHEVTQGAFEVDYIVGEGEVATNFTAEVDGVFFNPDAITVGETFFNGVTRFNILALDSATLQKMGLFFPLDIEIGTYEMDMSLINGSEIFAQYTPENGVSETFISNPGTLTITENDEEAGVIEGTFTFNAVDPLNIDPTVYTITTGEFTLEY